MKRPRTWPANLRRGSAAVRHNGYKIPLMGNLVKRAIRGA